MTDLTATTALDDWAAIESLFPTGTALKPKGLSAAGISSRLPKGRLERLFNHRGAGPLSVLLDQMVDDRVKAMRTFAAINLEQAVSAFKITLIANVTAPLLIVAFLNQIVPGGIGDQLYDIYGGEGGGLYALFGVIALMLVTLMVLSLYALANLNQARDIRNLIDLFAAERGIYFGLEDISDLHSS